MKVQESARRQALRMLACIFLAATLLPAFGQVAGDPQSLQTPPAGIFDRRSWTYWNVRYRHIQFHPCQSEPFRYKFAKPVGLSQVRVDIVGKMSAKF